MKISPLKEKKLQKSTKSNQKNKSLLTFTKESEKYDLTSLTLQNILKSKNYLNSQNEKNETNPDFDQISFSNSIFSISPEKPKITTNQKNKISTNTCSCKKSSCLRLHCSCFSTLGFCSEFCKCKNCLNKSKFKIPRDFVIKKTKMIYENAFRAENSKISFVGGFKISKDGCNCKKGCFNNYCGCRKIGGKCSPICRCGICGNSKVILDRKEIREIYKPVFRKKSKIVVDFNNSLVKFKNLK